MNYTELIFTEISLIISNIEQNLFVFLYKEHIFISGN